MKRICSLFVFLCILGTSSAFAQLGALSIQNVHLDGTAVVFDVYLLRTTTTTLYLTQSSLYFSFDGSKFSNPTASFVRGTSFQAYPAYVDTTILYDVSPNRLLVDISFPQSPTMTNTVKISAVGTGTKIGTVTLSGLTTLTTDIALHWSVLPPFETVAYYWDPNPDQEYPILHSLVEPSFSAPIAVNLKAVLQGAHSSAGVMNTNLYAQSLLPTTDPYGQNVTVPSISANVVDWVSLEFRSPTDSTVSVADTVGFLKSDGSIVALDGVSQILMSPNTLQAGYYYVVIRHRNHLAIMSATPLLLLQNSSAQYDFTTSQGQAISGWDMPMVQVASSPDVFAMVAGDVSGDGIINAVDRVAISNGSGTLGYTSLDANLDGIVNAVDRTIASNNTFRGTQVP